MLANFLKYLWKLANLRNYKRITKIKGIILGKTRCYILILIKIGSGCLNNSDATPKQVGEEKVLLEVASRSVGSWTNRRYVDKDV